MKELGDVLVVLEQGGTAALMLLILVGGFRKWWVFGWQHDELRKDRDEWKTLALQGTALLDRAVDVAVRPRSG